MKNNFDTVADDNEASGVIHSITGQTTDVRGRFVISGDTFQLVSDGSANTGAPGLAAGPIQLLMASLASCILNVIRGSGEPETEIIPHRPVRLRARSQQNSVERGLGQLHIEVFVGGVSDEEAQDLVENYKRVCRIYHALQSSWDINIIGRAEPAQESISASS